MNGAINSLINCSYTFKSSEPSAKVFETLVPDCAEIVLLVTVAFLLIYSVSYPFHLSTLPGMLKIRISWYIDLVSR